MIVRPLCCWLVLASLAAAQQRPRAFVAPVRPDIPAVDRQHWNRNPIDAFVLGRMRAAGLEPAAAADDATLVRRLSLDLTGLPATAGDLAFLQAQPPALAWQRLVDRKLAEPAYAERMAAVWLDLARYADSAGYGSDPLRTIWRYRDWVIEAYQQNMPFDRFTELQIAGDLLPGATWCEQLPTAFHRNTKTNTEGGTDDEEFRVEAVRDRVDTTMQVWMGVTFGCAKCHDHKYDPFTTREYYQVCDVFNHTADTDRADEAPVIETPVARQEGELESSEVVETPVMVELGAGERRQTHVLLRGSFLARGERVHAAVPASMHPAAEGVKVDRLAFAHWLCDRRNPLTARVQVNRLWARIFGTGIVATEEDFGSQGEPPSHPELLDWLAVEFMDSGWDVQHVLKIIVTSATYRQAAGADAHELEVDPDGRLLSRSPRVRLEAEMVRDQALAFAGLLSSKRFGWPVYPAQPEGLWQAAFNGSDRSWVTSRGEDRYRRAIYTFLRRSSPYPAMTTFDAPTREICTARRIRTNTPLQALVTLNDPVFVECAQALARRIVREGGVTPRARVRWALRTCLLRDDVEREAGVLEVLYADARAHWDGRVDDARSFATEPLGPLVEGEDPVELAAWTAVANVLLNLDAVLQRP